MTVKFLKAHTTKDGRSFTVGQITEISDTNLVQELIRQGVVKEHKAGEPEDPSA